jgi:hypothetical protein
VKKLGEGRTNLDVLLLDSRHFSYGSNAQCGRFAFDFLKAVPPASKEIGVVERPWLH